MKKVKLLMIVGTLAISTPAFAQFSNASGASSSSADIAPYDRLSVSYQYDTQSLDVDDADDINLNGVAVDYLHGFSISKTLPLYLETGLGLNYGYWSDSDESGDVEVKTSIKALSFSVPVNLAYKFNIQDGVSIQPFVGVNLKLNALGKYKYEQNSDSEYIEDESSEADYFDKDEVGEDGQWKRFQIGWHIGAGLNYKAFYVGLSYGTDFMELAKKLNTSTFKVGIGYNF